MVCIELSIPARKAYQTHVGCLDKKVGVIYLHAVSMTPMSVKLTTK